MIFRHPSVNPIFKGRTIVESINTHQCLILSSLCIYCDSFESIEMMQTKVNLISEENFMLFNMQWLREPIKWFGLLLFRKLDVVHNLFIFALSVVWTRAYPRIIVSLHQLS